MDEILAAMAQHGLNPGNFPLDGKIFRFRLDEKDKKKSGWCLGYQNSTRKSGETFFVARFGSYRTSESHSHHSLNVTYTAEDKKFLQEQIRKAKKTEFDARRKAQEEIAADLPKFWDTLVDDGPSEYLERKQISGHSDLSIKFNGKGNIYVPLKDIEGKQWSYQVVRDGGKKLFLTGGRVQGCFHIIGDSENQSVFFIAEGFATAASIRIATGQTVVCAFNSGNLLAAAKAIRSKNLTAAIVICGDDDRWKDPNKNPGREAADEAAKEIGAKVAYPTFSNLDSQPTDWNDLHCLEGIEEVQRQLDKIEPSKLPANYDRHYVINSPYPDDAEGNEARRGTLANFAELLNRLGIIVRYNVISKEEEILIPKVGFTSDNRANATMGLIIDWCERVKIPTSHIKTYITTLADSNLYNPVATWITSKPWDGVDRMDDFSATIVAKREDVDLNVKLMKERLLLLWMTSAVAAAFEPDGVSAHGVLTLQGDQYLGKTKWFLNLTPRHLNVAAAGQILRPDDKDSVFQAISKWLIELGELDGTLSRSDESRLKAWLTNRQDTLRRPFAMKESVYARRTVFFGSVNPLKFLKDPTGNRRFWVIECESINYDHGLDMQQIWAQIYESYYLKGGTWYLSAIELEGLNIHNEHFQETDPVEERIKEHFAWGQEGHAGVTIQRLSATQVLLDIGYKEPKPLDAKKAGAILRKLCLQTPTIVRGVTKFFVPVRAATF